MLFPGELDILTSGAEERNRTSMGLPPPAPKAGASASFATSASDTRKDQENELYAK